MDKQILRLLLISVLAVGSWIPGVAQADNAAHIEQVGDGHTANVEQTGFANQAYTTQGGGSQNWITVQQVAPSGLATVQQQGSSNTAQLSQTTGPLGTISATFTQVGDRNVGTVTQTSTTGENSADVYQRGTDNVARVIQDAPGDNELTLRQWGGSQAAAGSENLIRLRQEVSTNNVAFLDQTGHENRFVGAISTGIDAAIDPDGYAYQYAGTGQNTVNLLQEGTGNVAGLYQWATADNYADIHQLGEGKSVAIYQEAHDGSNWVQVLPNGDAGNGNTATVHQISVTGNNVATVYQ